MFKGYKGIILFTLLFLNQLLNGQCNNYYITVSPNFNSSVSAVFQLNLATGDLTRITPDLNGFITALGMTPSADKFYMADPPDQQNQLNPIFKSNGISPLVDTPFLGTNLKLGGPRMCVSTDGQKIYSISSTFPGTDATTFHVRRSNINTLVEDTAQVIDAAGVPMISNSDGDIHMTSEGKLYMIDGPGNLYEIDLSSWSGTHVTAKKYGKFVPILPFEQFYAIGQDSKGNLVGIGSSSTFYKLRLTDKKVVALGTAKYSQAFSNLTTFTTDAATCSYPLFHTVSGYVYFDANQNANKENSENGISQTMYAKILYLGKVYAVATVDPVTGYYKFDVNIPNSDYTVVYSTNDLKTDATSIVPSGFTATSPTTNSIVVDAADVNNVNFGLYSTSLAVDLAVFTAEKKGATVELNWVTNSEANSNYFEIERSIDGVNFEVIGSKAAAGNSVSSISYQYIDKYPSKGYNYYRLKEIDQKYHATNSSIVSVYYTSADGYMVVSPNPIASEYKVNLNSVSTGNYVLQIFNFSGSIIDEKQFELLESKMELNLNSNHLENGWYYIRVLNKDNNHQFVEKISISK